MTEFGRDDRNRVNQCSLKVCVYSLQTVCIIEPMNLLKNKHMILAMFIAPVLAIMAYFATDSLVSEKPHRAETGEQYKLAARSNCRYESGLCTLHNGDVEIDIRINRLSASTGEPFVELLLQSNTPLQQALVSLGPNDAQPVALTSDADMLSWRADLDTMLAADSELRLAVMISGTAFYASVATVFIDYDTSFSRENFTR